MRRYWKLITLSLAVVLVMGPFFIKQALSHNGLPDYVIQVKSGKASLAKNLVISGSYTNQSASYLMRTTTKGTNYQTGGLIDSISNQFEPQKLQELQKRDRNFMRGKVKSLNAFYEDSQILAYAFEGTHRGVGPGRKFDLKVSVLDKTNHNATYTMSLPIDSLGYYFMDVVDVQRVGNVLKVVTQNGGAKKEDFHVYTIDFANQKLMKDDTIKNNVTNTSGQSYNVLTDNQPLGSNHVIVLVGQVKGALHLYKCNLESMKRTELKVPEKLKSQSVNPIAFHGDRLYFEQDQSHSSTLYEYNVMTQKVVRKESINNPSGSLGVRINGDYAYLLKDSQANKGTPLEIINLMTGKTLLKGEIVPKQSIKQVKGTKVSFYDLQF